MIKPKAGQSAMAIGAPSIIMIFVVLCLTCFAALSFVSANADFRLAERTAKNTADYYAAHAQAQRRLQQADTAIQSAPGAQARKDALLAQGWQLEERADGVYASMQTPISDVTAIETEIRLAADAKSYALIRSCTVVNAALVYEEIPEIWDGSTLYAD